MAGCKVLFFLVLALAITFVSAARLLDEEEEFGFGSVPLPTTSPGPLPTAVSGPFPTANSVPAIGVTSGTGPASGGLGPLNTITGPGPLPATGSSLLPVANSIPLPTIGPGPVPTTGSGSFPVAGSGPLPTAGSGPLPAVGAGAIATGLGTGAGSGATATGLGTGAGSGTLPIAGSGPLPGVGSGPLPVGSGATATGQGAGAGSAAGGLVPDHTIVFYMHDILGGSNPTARAVTGVVANSALSGQLPFAKPNGANLPVSNGVPSDSNNNGIINNNNVPFLVGLGGTTSNILQNNGNNLLNGLPVANGGQLPSGSSLQMLMFGTLTVMDNELTEGHELGSGLLGKAQGFYVASSLDGTSQTMAFTAMFESGGYEDSISFFGVHRTAVSESHLGVMGGTGKFVNARGFAIVKTFTGANGNQQQQLLPQLFTDGLETVLECTVYLTY